MILNEWMLPEDGDEVMIQYKILCIWQRNKILLFK